ncbi:MAG TPA: tryptophan--tRNA ligase, partial [Frankiaceae bacterium]|nr:tryptophan--tRNA ligase [Frankiaceae bacterium]
VPVGEDQRQHLELTRDLAQRFNARFGDTFTVPEPYILRRTAKILDLQSPDKQMSKSAANQAGVLYLLEEPGSLRRKVRAAVTDSGRQIRAADDKPGITNLLTIYSMLTGRQVAELEGAYDGKGYGDLKGDLAQVVTDFAGPVRERVRELLAEPDRLDDVLAEGARKARKVASATLAAAYDRVGFLPAR